MGKIRDIQRKLELFVFDDVLDASIESKEKTIVKLNQDQLALGYKSNGEKMPIYHQDFYIRYKESKGSKSVPFTDLKDTGSFYDAFTIDIGCSAFDIKSTDKKNSELVKKYGSDIFGLNEQSISQLSKKIKTIIITEILNLFK